MLFYNNYLVEIVVSKINSSKENMKLEIFLKLSNNFFASEVKQVVTQRGGNFMKKTFEFKRGYDITATRRYTVKYQVTSYICI